ncbi:hypothetical protein [Flavobacterium lipolyticum]|uniref:Peptidase S74 domain-containing protein n=1 Tax=Flavobacterium lipolyticum TaxID=2893754 RepID=A0ABS8M1M2_9FLAO|nr:hypothetical protein [Flavobacterium sp. F-126]MCC9018574.1 hypothetical protein [Flavobacterium sp. F-126]
MKNVNSLSKNFQNLLSWRYTILMAVLLFVNLSYSQTYQELMSNRYNQNVNEPNWTFSLDNNKNEQGEPGAFSWFANGGGNLDNLMMCLRKSDSEKMIFELRLPSTLVVQNRATPGAVWDNLTIYADGYSSFIESNGDERGMFISSKTGNKISLGDSNDDVTINSKKLVLKNNAGGDNLAQVAINTDTPTDGVALTVGGKTWMRGELRVASSNPIGQHDNFKVLVGNEKTDLISYGDDNGMFISSDLGNKVTLGDSNDEVAINAKKLILDYGEANDLAQVAINAGNPVNKAALTVGGKVYIGESKNIETHPEIGEDLEKDCSLFVEKQILASDLNIIPKPHWKDAVFENDYKKMDLSALEGYVKENKHLPGIVSEKEVKEKGYKIHVFNEGLLQNVEELLLHIIDQNKKIEELNKRIKALEK